MKTYVYNVLCLTMLACLVIYEIKYCVFQCLTIVKDDFVVIWDLVKAEVVSIANFKYKFQIKILCVFQDSGDACILLSYCNKTQAIEAHTEEIKKQEAVSVCGIFNIWYIV